VLLSGGALLLATVVGIGAAVWFFFARTGPAGADLRAVPNQNVLLITIDTLRADALGSYGGVAATPGLVGIASVCVRLFFAV
jgi:hypothetical protein